MFDFEKHERIALQFSGGKDSLACLFLLQDYWDKLTVFWVNTGATFRETRDLMEFVRNTVPNFVEIKSDVMAHQEEFGFPVDLLPVSRTPLGRTLDGHSKLRMQSTLSCCAANIWGPMVAAMQEFKPTLIIRGQRADDFRKAPLRSGDIHDGIQYLLPVQNWTSEQVKEYLGDKLPGYYRTVNVSLDCWSCTGYLYESVEKHAYMAALHPAQHEIVKARLCDLAREVVNDTKHLFASITADSTNG